MTAVPQEFDWAMVRQRYQPGMRLASLRGDTYLEVVEVDDDRLCLRQRLWRDCLTRQDLETAVSLLRDGIVTGTAMEFAEGLRRQLSGGPYVRTDCSRIPNMTAVVLKDLGYLDGA
ncbi:MAG: hypothetical protein GEU83_18455 [Pseudonocardiaceae bacterium]|nr:hypothetical protein [Pseudonocardiaceae bacterium]